MFPSRLSKKYVEPPPPGVPVAVGVTVAVAVAVGELVEVAVGELVGVNVAETVDVGVGVVEPPVPVLTLMSSISQPLYPLLPASTESKTNRIRPPAIGVSDARTRPSVLTRFRTVLTPDRVPAKATVVAHLDVGFIE